MSLRRNSSNFNFQGSLCARSELVINSQVSLVVPESGDAIYFKAMSEGCTLLSGREMFSFGSGSWYDGSCAAEAMESDGQWIPLKLSWQTPIILERKKLLSHLASLPCLEKAVPLRQVLSELQDAGEASVGKSRDCARDIRCKFRKPNNYNV